jgi:hypothetical protein
LHYNPDVACVPLSTESQKSQKMPLKVLLKQKGFYLIWSNQSRLKEKKEASNLI